MTFQADSQRITKLISSMRVSINLLQELAAIPKADFFGDVHKQSSAKYNFIAAIEAAIDLANHIISINKLRAPEDYGDAFIALCEAGMLPADFSQELVKMARFRNRLVHLYWDVNLETLHDILATRIGDFNRFLSELGKCLSLD